MIPGIFLYPSWFWLEVECKVFQNFVHSLSCILVRLGIYGKMSAHLGFLASCARYFFQVFGLDFIVFFGYSAGNEDIRDG